MLCVNGLSNKPIMPKCPCWKCCHSKNRALYRKWDITLRIGNATIKTIITLQTSLHDTLRLMNNKNAMCMHFIIFRVLCSFVQLMGCVCVCPLQYFPPDHFLMISAADSAQQTLHEFDISCACRVELAVRTLLAVLSLVAEYERSIGSGYKIPNII